MLNKIKIVLSIIILLGILYSMNKVMGYISGLENSNNRLHTELIGQKEKYDQLNKHTAKLESQYIQQKELLKKSEERFKEIVKSKDERIKLLSDATYLIGQHVSKQDGPDYYFETPNRTRNYVLNELRLSGDSSPPIGYILIKNDGRTYKRNYKFEIKVETLQTVDENTGKIKVYSKAFLISKESSPLAKRVDGYKDWNDIQYPLNIIGGTALIDPTIKNQLKPKWFIFAPHLNANIDFKGIKPSPGLGLSISGYGITKNDLKFKFLQLGTHYSSQDGFKGTLSPVLWRPFSNIMSNTYLGPGITLDDGKISYFIGLSIGL